MSYTLPQVQVNQFFSQVPLNSIKNQNAFVFGPNYELFRYAVADEKAQIAVGTYDGTAVVDEAGDSLKLVPYPAEAGEVDLGYVKVFADNVVVELFHLDGFQYLPDAETGTDFDGNIRFPGHVLAGKARDEQILRDVAPGDLVRIKYKDSNDQDKWFESSILSVYPFDEFDATEIDCIRVADTLPSEVLAALTSNDMSDAVVYFCANIQAVEIPSRNHVPGMFNWVAKAEGVQFGELDSNDRSGQFPGIDILYPAWSSTEYLRILSADLFVEHRDLILSAATSILSIESIDDVENMLGKIDPDNPLAFGVYKTKLNSGDRVVYYMATKGTSLSDFSDVLGKASLTDEVYIMVPLSQDKEILDQVKTHVLENSAATEKRWRIAFINYPADPVDCIYDAQTSIDGKGFFATVTEGKNPASGKTEAVYVRFVDGEGSTTPSTATKANSQVVAGDIVRIYHDDGKGNIEVDPWDKKTKLYDDYTIAKVLSNTVVLLKSQYEVLGGILENGPIEAGVRVEVYHKRSYAEMAEAIAAVSSAWASRRVYNTFPNVVSNAGKTFGGEFVAACCGGLVSSVLPQQPVTNVEINGIDDIPMVYQTYSRTDLNKIAEGGTFIVMQDLPGAKVYVRHQISTAYKENNLLTSELSITKNLDSISYLVAERFAPYIGKYNITPEIIEVLKVVMNKLLVELESSTSAGLYGPQVLQDGTEVVDISQDPVHLDHVNATVNLALPLPLNNLVFNLYV